MDAVFVFQIKDHAAAAWRAQVAVVAPDKRAALRKVRDAGAHLRDIQGKGHSPEVHSIAEFGTAFANPHTILRRRDEDGWTEWAAVSPTESLHWRGDG